MSDDQSKSRPTAGPWIVAAMLLLPVIYVLSLGPAVWLLNRTGPGTFTEQVFDVAFAPLRWLHDNNQACGAALEWYVELWER